MQDQIPALSVFYWGSVQDGKRILSHHRFEQGRWRTEPLFERAHQEPVWEGMVIFRLTNRVEPPMPIIPELEIRKVKRPSMSNGSFEVSTPLPLKDWDA